MLVIAGSIRIDAAMRDELTLTAIEVVQKLRKQVAGGARGQPRIAPDRGDPRSRREAGRARDGDPEIRRGFGRTRKRAGCISFACSADLEDPNLLHVFLEWETADALFALLDAERVAAVRQNAEKLGLRDISLQRYEITSVGPIV